MAGRSSLVASAQQVAALRELAGWTASEIGEAFGVGADSVRRWRAWFAQGGVEALCSTLAPGPSPERGERALACARNILATPVQDRPNWTLPRLRARANRPGDFAEIEARTGVRVAQSHLSVLLRRGLPVAAAPPQPDRAAGRARGGTGGLAAANAPRAGRGGRRGAALRRRERGADPRRFRCAKRRSCLAHAWAERGADLRVQAPGQARKVAILGVLDAMTRLALVHTSPTKRSNDFIALLERLDRAYGPVPGQTRKPVVLVLDNGPIHASKATTKALAARPWITGDWLPRYAPELNLIEATWRDLKRHHLAHRTFRDTDDLDQAIHQAVSTLNEERTVTHSCHNLPKAA